MDSLKLVRKSIPWSVIPREKMPSVIEQVMAGVPYSEIARQWGCSAKCVKDSIKRFKK